ncbi:UNVERIFIED_CONTAM: hypothetical protein Slati_0585500 [Sesamum latifolium]|uniref:Uncharacterized protein n=1 Tax=Sesamum latifolium TaxID=2727402 RepID=A0AAW2Y1H5_9LAMI
MRRIPGRLQLAVGMTRLSRIQTLGISVVYAKIVDVILVGKGDVGRRGRLAGGFSGGQVSCSSSASPPPLFSSTALVEYKPPAANPEDEDLEIKLRRIIECVPVRVSNTSGSSAGRVPVTFIRYSIPFIAMEYDVTYKLKFYGGYYFFVGCFVVDFALLPVDRLIKKAIFVNKSLAPCCFVRDKIFKQLWMRHCDMQ